MTDRCRALIELLADPTDGRTRGEKFRAVGFSETYGYVLVRKPAFIRALQERAKELIGGHLSDVLRQIYLDAIDPDNYAGDRTRAGRTLMEVAGMIGPNVQVNVQTNIDVELSEEARARRIAEVRASRLVAPPIQDAGRPVRAIRE